MRSDHVSVSRKKRKSSFIVAGVDFQVKDFEVKEEMETGSTMKMYTPVFDGEDKSYQMWWAKFKAYAGVQGFTQALAGREANLPATEGAQLDPDDDVTDRQRAALKRNALAMAHLVQAMKTEGLMAIIYEVQTADWPTGLAFEAAALLRNKHQPNDMFSIVEMRQALNKIKMKEGENPAKLFEQLAVVSNRFRDVGAIAEAQQIAVILNAAPKTYHEILTGERLRHGNALTVEHL